MADPDSGAGNPGDRYGAGGWWRSSVDDNAQRRCGSAGPGDPDGSGTALFTFNPGQEEICYDLTVTGVAPIRAAHIHVGAAGSPGPVVVGLAPPTNGASSGCTSADRDLILAIIQNPELYYVNVHNAEYPAGALRGQLSK